MSLMLKEFTPCPIRELQQDGLVSKSLIYSYKKQIGRILNEDGEEYVVNRGWIGIIPELDVMLTPKVPVGNLFRMMEYAYCLPSLSILSGEAAIDSLTDFYDSLAILLARRILDRCRKGVYRSYEDRQESLGVVRGRILLPALFRQSVIDTLPCLFEEQMADNEENRLLRWTLYFLSMAYCKGRRAEKEVCRAERELSGRGIRLQHYPADACQNRHYTRLNEDYRLLHGLCRLFLEHSGPKFATGNQNMPPFLLDGARLFEFFVAQWLTAKQEQKNFPFSIKRQFVETVEGVAGSVTYQYDLLLTDINEPSRVCAVVDTKYKYDKKPGSADYYQMVAYAHKLSAPLAVLVYPYKDIEPFDVPENGIRVCSVGIDLELEDVEVAMNDFMCRLIELVNEYKGNLN